jgi:hypothetical protein
MTGALDRMAPAMHAPTSSAQAAAPGRAPCACVCGGEYGALG